MRNLAKLSLLGMTFTAMSLAACADDVHTFRTASVGAAPSSGDGGSGSGDNSNGSGSGSGVSGSGGANGSGSGTSGGANGSSGILVAGGNVLVGAAAQYSALTSATNGLVPLSGTVNGTVTAVLRNSGHTLIELNNGTSVLLNGTGGGVGDVLSLNLGSGQVVGGPANSPLIGANILAADPVTGTLATVSAASGDQLVGVTVLDSALGSGGSSVTSGIVNTTDVVGTGSVLNVGGVLGTGGAPAGGVGNGNNVVISPAIAPALGLGAAVNNTVNATVGGLLGH